jgi:sugar phosphate isomerase/epimerase
MIDACAAGRSERAPAPELIERWLPSGHVAHVHLNDPNRRGPGQGDLRFGPILAALDAHGYAGLCSVEPFVYESDLRGPRDRLCTGASREHDSSLVAAARRFGMD